MVIINGQYLYPMKPAPGANCNFQHPLKINCKVNENAKPLTLEKEKSTESILWLPLKIFLRLLEKFDKITTDLILKPKCQKLK